MRETQTERMKRAWEFFRSAAEIESEAGYMRKDAEWKNELMEKARIALYGDDYALFNIDYDVLEHVLANVYEHRLRDCGGSDCCESDCCGSD